jgi:hypothetical protein
MAVTYVKKTIWLNQSHLRKAVRIFHARSEKEAVNRALELAVEEEAIIEAHKSVEGAGEVEEIYA